MGIEFEDDQAVFSGVIGPEHAEALLGWLDGRSGARVALEACTHLHPSSLQVLMAARPVVASWPADAGLATWLRSALR